jgi:hypothetical protein
VLATKLVHAKSIWAQSRHAAKAAEFIGLSERQVRRLCAAFEERGPRGLVSGKRGLPSNRRLPEELRSQAIEIVRERYADFGPTLACEKLLELHDLRVSKGRKERALLLWKQVGDAIRAWLAIRGTAHRPRGLANRQSARPVHDVWLDDGANEQREGAPRRHQARARPFRLVPLRRLRDQVQPPLAVRAVRRFSVTIDGDLATFPKDPA